MDGIHDLGGKEGFGRIEYEPAEPVFHARWEARV
ncbi:MAG: nitrile hydratase subunit beta, partial [Gammaproteobacteria bacterium]|nr:nitrile hydratase subunit beta [Gammaproteobacteria bacterium]